MIPTIEYLAYTKAFCKVKNYLRLREPRLLGIARLSKAFYVKCIEMYSLTKDVFDYTRRAYNRKPPLQALGAYKPLEPTSPWSLQAPTSFGAYKPLEPTSPWSLAYKPLEPLELTSPWSLQAYKLLEPTALRA